MRVDCPRAFCRALASTCVLALLLSSCSGKHPFLQVQICTGDAQGVTSFKNALQDIAHAEQMRYIDGSDATTRDLKVLKPGGKNIHTDGRLVHVGLEGDGYGLTAGNLGLHPYDITVGFNPDTPAARAFSERVVARLKGQWAIKVVPEGFGAFLDPQCAGGAATPPNSSSKPKPLRGSA